MSQEQIPLEALSQDTGCDFSRNTNPKCPHCGAVYSISDNDAWELYDADKEHDIECPSCELSFMVSAHATYSFSTDDQSDYEL